MAPGLVGAALHSFKLPAHHADLHLAVRLSNLLLLYRVAGDVFCTKTTYL